MKPDIISFVLSLMVVSFSSMRLSCFIPFSTSSVSSSLIIDSLSGYFFMIGNVKV